MEIKKAYELNFKDFYPVIPFCFPEQGNDLPKSSVPALAVKETFQLTIILFFSVICALSTTRVYTPAIKLGSRCNLH